MPYRRIVCLCVIAVFMAQPILADVLQTRTGEKFVGTLANREQVRNDPRSSRTIGMLLSDSGELLRFRVEDVDYVVLQDGDRDQVIDLLSAPGSDPLTGSQYRAKHRDDYTGVVLIVVGAAIAAFGALDKFGGPKCTVDESSIDCDEESYDTLNYALMGVGGLLVVVGIVQSSNPNPQHSGVLSHSTPTVWVRAQSGSESFGLGYRFVF